MTLLSKRLQVGEKYFMRDSNYKLPQDWYRSGDEDIISAKILLKEGGPNRIISFHCQQGAEKYLKGFLLLRKGKYPKSHDLLEIITLCQEVEKDFASIKQLGAILNPYYMESRYFATTSEGYSREDSEKAIEKATSIIKFVKERSPKISD